VRDRWALPLIGVVSFVVLAGVSFVIFGRAPAMRGRIDVTSLGAVNAMLNGTAAVLLAYGWICIRQRRVTAHKRCMLSAFVSSSLFLISYLVYHSQVGSVPFRGQGWVRAVYFTLLISHIILAAVIVPLALTTIYRALSGDFPRHVPLARWTLPIWLYVSVTGVAVYLMLHHLT
jgi:putative membrane protein